MRRSVSFALFLLLVLSVLSAMPLPAPAHAQGGNAVTLRSQYTLNRYGFAVINESMKVVNNGSSTVSAPTLTFGFGNLTGDIVAYSLTGSSFTSAPTSPSGPFTVAGPTVQAGGNSSYVLSLLVDNVVAKATNGSLKVLFLSTPSLSASVERLIEVVQMPASTTLKVAPTGLKGTFSSTNDTYSAVLSNASPQAAVTSVRFVASSPAADFNPLRVYEASRVINVGSSGSPVVVDTISFENMGTTLMSGLYVKPLTSLNARVTVLTQSEPRLLSPITLPLNNGALDLSVITVAYPTTGVPAGENYSVSYQYPLASQYFTDSGGQVTVNIPKAPPLGAFVNSYTIAVNVPVGAKASQAGPSTMTDVTPWQGGTVALGYALTAGWGVEQSVPAASIIFFVLLLGLFVSRVTLTEEVETEEESSSGLASSMINAFEEKSNLINGLWPEITSKDVNEMDKAYFDELRGRLDSFRSRALQRLNELRQKSTSQRFSELLNQIQASEREVDRAAKDKLNLYEQFNLNRMRKEVYDRLLPQYTKRLEKALDQLSDELHLVQREAKVQ